MSRLLLVGAERLYVNSLHHLLAVGHRGLLEGLARAEFAYDAGLFKFAFEFLESLLDVLTFIYMYDEHVVSLDGLI